MSTVERRLREAMTDAPVRPSPDLFARVQAGVADDRRRRARRWRAAAYGLAGCAAVLAALTPFTSVDNGRISMSWWLLEVLTTTALVALALWLGPFIKRFGRAYAADVFHDNPLTGKSYIVLADIVYYLIFTAYILFTVRFEAASDWGGEVGPRQLQYETARVGGILLVIGVLHGLNLLVMPVLGRLFSLNRRMVPPIRAREQRGVDLD